MLKKLIGHYVLPKTIIFKKFQQNNRYHMKIKEQISNNHILAITIGLVYLWFGGLKFFSHLSPAEDLAKNTIDVLTFGFIPSNIAIILLAVWETFIGVFLIINVFVFCCHVIIIIIKNVHNLNLHSTKTVNNNP